MLLAHFSGASLHLARGCARFESEDSVNRSNWAKELAKGGLVLLALVVAFLAWIGFLSLTRHAECNRLDAARISYLEPGHDLPGPGSIYVKGVGAGPPPSQLSQYLEAEAEMKNAGCPLPAGALLNRAPTPSDGGTP